MVITGVIFLLAAVLLSTLPRHYGVIPLFWICIAVALTLIIIGLLSGQHHGDDLTAYVIS